VVDPHEPLLPGKITIYQAWQFAKAPANEQQDGWDIVKNKIREVVRVLGTLNVTNDEIRAMNAKA
jgi:hypothetical protein